jgi:hypothetical protein
MTISTIVIVNVSDWAGLYFDGELIDQNEEFTAWDVAETAAGEPIILEVRDFSENETLENYVMTEQDFPSTLTALYSLIK